MFLTIYLMEKSFREIIKRSEELAKALASRSPDGGDLKVKAVGLLTWAGNLSEALLLLERKEPINLPKLEASLHNLLFLATDIAGDMKLSLADGFIAYLNDIIAHLNKEASEGQDALRGRGQKMEGLKSLYENSESSVSLTPALQKLYGGNFTFYEFQNRPYVIGNFVMATDGIVSFSDIPGHTGGGDVSAFNPQDTFIMGLLRSVVDGVAVGANTLRTEPHHIWTPKFISPEHDVLYQEQRRFLGKKSENPANIFVTASGEINFEAAVFYQTDVISLVVTTEQGASRVQKLADDLRTKLDPNRYFTFHTVIVKKTVGGQVDLSDMMQKLKHEWDINSLLVEGGPTFYGNLEKAGLVDELFLTISPIVVGNAKASQRPTFSMTSERGYTPNDTPYTELVSVKQRGDYLYLRRKYRHK